MGHSQTGSKLDFAHLNIVFSVQREQVMLFSAYHCDRLMSENSDSF